MSGPSRVAIVCEGDAESWDKAYSGIAKSMVDQLRSMGHTVSTINARPGKSLRAVTALASYSPNRGAWKARFRYGSAASMLRNRVAEAGLAPIRNQVDIVLQMGASNTPPGAGQIPYALYSDWNMALSIRDRAHEHSSVHHLSPGEAEAINRRHRVVYENASVIFTICEALRQSFIADYGISPERVITAYAGPNFGMNPPVIPERKARPSAAPSILFVGKEFDRKGGNALLAAFKLLRKEFPTLRLTIVGPVSLPALPDGVENLGFLRKDVAEDKQRLIHAFEAADVFCLPTRYEPFGIAVLEAMLFGLPCVTSDTWAIPEMVVDGETGFTVPADNPMALSGRLSEILRDPELGMRMGSAGRQRANSLFTWEAAAQRIHAGLEGALARRATPEVHPRLSYASERSTH